MKYRFTKNDITCRRNNFGNLVLSVMLDCQLIEHTYIFYPKTEATKKFQQQYGTYPKDYKPIATLPLTNFGGLAVMEIDHGVDDYVWVTENYGDGYKNITRNKIQYNKKGESYFIRNGHTWYLKDFMKC